MQNYEIMRLTVHAAILALAANLFAGCATTEQRREITENAESRKQAADEIERICRLEGSEREAAVEKLKKDSGFSLHCAEK